MTDSGELLGWGYNASGQIATGNTTNTGTPFLMASGVQDFWVGGGSHGTVHIKKSDGVYACGNNAYGQLGVGDTTHQKSFKKTNLPSNVDKIFTCGYHNPQSVHARTTDGRLFSTGYNGYGTLGLGDVANRKNFTEVSLPCYPAQVRNQTDLYGSGNGLLLVVDPAGDLYACGTSSFHMFNEGGNRHATHLTRVNVL